MSVVLAGILLPDPTVCDPTRAPTGTLHRTADNSPDYSYAGTTPTRRSWAVRWEDVTDQERDLIGEAYDLALVNAVQWTPPNETAIYRVRAINDYRGGRGNWLRFPVSFTLEEV